MYIFEMNSLSVASFATIFSQSEGCLFTVLIVSCVVQKRLSLIRSHLFIFAFVSNILDVGHRGSCCDLCQRMFCLCFHVGLMFMHLLYQDPDLSYSRPSFQGYLNGE